MCIYIYIYIYIYIIIYVYDTVLLFICRMPHFWYINQQLKGILNWII